MLNLEEMFLEGISLVYNSVTNVLCTKTFIVLFFALVKLKVKVKYSVEFVINNKSIVARKLTIRAL